MPDIKSTFTQGKMNKSLDERIIPKGQYKDAMNIQVSTSDDSDVGTVQNILGNTIINTINNDDGESIGNNWECVGSIADEKNNKLYWFGCDDTNNIDAIFEYDTNPDTGPELNLILVDSNHNVLKFEQDQFITGINIVDNLLMWTDGFNEPRCINIDDCRSGSTNLSTQTQFTGGVTGGDIKEEHITLIKKKPTQAPIIELVTTGSALTSGTSQSINFSAKVIGDTIVVKVILDNKLVASAGTVYNDGSGSSDYVASDGNTYNLDGGSSSENNTYDFFDGIPLNINQEDVLLLSDPAAQGILPNNAQIRLVVDSAPSVGQTFNSAPGAQEWEQSFTCTILTINPDVPTTTVSYDFVVEDLEDLLFNKTFPRFSYRYKYKDGEYSAFGPFTDIIFAPGQFSIHPTREPYNSGMETRIKEVVLKDFVTYDIPDGVVEIDLLYKPDNSTVVYAIDTVIYSSTNKAWTTVDGTNITIDLPSTSGITPSNTGFYRIKSENIYAALPSNQLLRPFDNVPKKAKAQDFTAGRLMYGNYTQNLNLGPDFEPNMYLKYKERTFADQAVGFDVGKQSIKSQRTYQAGVVYGDEYGRETPVFTYKNASKTIPYNANTDGTFYGNASASNMLYFRAYTSGLRIKSNDNSEAINYEPYYFKVFIKETSSEYYNLVMDRVYRAEEDGNLWISFPSSDRNKIQEDDYIILKKAIDSDYQVDIENKFKVIDIKNEAPEFIRKKYISLGQFDGNGTLTDLYTEQANQPSKSIKSLTISKDQIQLESGTEIQNLFDNDKKIYINFEATPSTNVKYVSKRYRIVSLKTEGSGPELYKIVLNEPIVENDGWVESSITNKTLETTLKTNLYLQEQDQWEEFQGRFFVKILSNVVTGQYLEGQIGTLQQYSISTSADIFNLADDSSASVGGVLQYTNSSGNQGLAGQTSGVSTHTTNSGAAGSISNTPAKWNNTTDGNLLFDGTSTTSSTGFFIDACYVAAMQPRIVSNMSNISYVVAGSDNDGAPDSNANKYDVSVSCNLFRGGYGGDGTGGSIDFGTNNNNWPNGFGGTVDAMPGIFTPTLPAFEIRKQIGGGGINNRNVDNFTYDSSGFYMHLSISGVGPHLFPSGSSIREGSSISNSELTKFLDPDWSGYGSSDHKINLHNIQNNNQQPFIYMGATGDGSTNDPGTNGSLGGYVYADRGMEVCNVPQDSSFDFNNVIDKTWDPLYNKPELADFIQNLKTPGSKFTFGTDNEVYTIQECEEVWIYNHTAWNRMAEWDGTNNDTFKEREDTVHFAYHDMIEKIRTSNSQTEWVTFLQAFNSKLTQFGAPDNRRVCYILKLDKDPTASSSSYNPTTQLTDANVGVNMRFVQSYVDETATIASDNPAVWETEPKENVDLDIYYEASNAIPLKLDINSSAAGSLGPDNRKGHMIAPIGTTVRCNKTDSHLSTSDFGDCVVKSWDGNMLEIEPGLDPDTSGSLSGSSVTDQTSVFNAKRIKFYKNDLSYVEVGIFQVEEIDSTSGLITKLSLDRTIRNIGLSYFNCYSFGNGVESNRIRDDFNQPFISNGVKASSTLKEQYTEDLRASGLIYSSIYNSTTSLNEINQFIMADTVTKDLLPTYGSIQKLFARNDDLIALCQDKIIQIPADKDIIFNADGNPQLTASNKVLGQARPFVGEYGISNNPESFASESYRAYFTDKQRGAVLRLSMDGLTPISDAGMSTYFKDKLKEDAFKIVGSYDTYKKEYNLTIDDGNKEINEFNSDSNSVTISFKEDVRGWVSFKSFIPESGLSMGGNYYTFYNSHLYQHHLGNRSVFYGQSAICSMTAVINESPLSIKNFTTLNYDGDSGWQATIQTEKQSGTVNSFIEKEGKWFNYIKGEEDIIDTNAINFQGVGTCTIVNTLS